MNVFELLCTEPDQWLDSGNCKLCPDCSSLVPQALIPNHVRWHQMLVCQLLEICEHQDQLRQHTFELSPEDPGDCVRLAYSLQLERLHEKDR